MKHWFIGLQGGLIALFLWSPLLYAAQHSDLLDGHILEEITLTSEADDTFLVIRGILSPPLFSEIEAIAGDDSNHWVIAIPQGLTNNLRLSQTLAFPPASVLESIDIEEDIQATGGDIQFQANLHVTARQAVVLSLMEDQSNAQQVTFLVLRKGVGGEVKTAQRSEASQMPQMPLLSDRGKETKDTAGGSQAPLVVGEPDKVLLHPVSAMMVFQRPTVLHLSILNASPNQEAAQRLAILLDRHQRKFLEDRLDMKMDITNISSVQEQTALPKTKIYFRPNYLTAALALATAIPGEQVVEEMSFERRGRLGLDVEIYVGANFE